MKSQKCPHFHVQSHAQTSSMHTNVRQEKHFLLLKVEWNEEMNV